MSWFNNIASKAKSVVKKAASTKFGKKVASIVKKAAPVVKKVVQSTPQYKTAKAVYKAVTPAKKSIQQVSKYIAPKVSTPAKSSSSKSSSSKSSSSKSSSSSKKSSSFSSKIQDVKNTVTASLPKISDLGQSKAYASSTPTYGTPQQSFKDKVLNTFGSLGLPDLGISEILGGNKASLQKQLSSQSGFALPTQIAGAAQPLGYLNEGRGLYNQESQPDYSSLLSDNSYLNNLVGQPQRTGNITFDPRQLPGVQGVANQRVSQPQVQSVGEEMPAYSPGESGAKSPSGEWTYTGNGVTGWEKTGTDQQLPPADTQEPYVDPMTRILNEIDPKLAEAWGLLNEDGSPALYDDLLKSNFADSEKFTNTWSENQKQQLELAYRKLKENYGNMSDEERRIADSALNRIQAELDILYGEGRKATQSVENTYGEAERARIKKAKLDEANARNLFSSLGTAESSSFIDKLMDLKQEGGRESYRADVEKAGKIADINDLINRSKVEAGNQKNEIITTRDRNIQSIQSQMNMSQQEKDYAIMEQNLLALQQMMQLQQQDQANRLAFLNNQMTAKSGTDQIMLQGIINNALLNKGYNIAG